MTSLSSKDTPSRLEQLPVDLLLCIRDNLDQNSVLRLSSTSKCLRKTYEGIWKQGHLQSNNQGIDQLRRTIEFYSGYSTKIDRTTPILPVETITLWSLPEKPSKDFSIFPEDVRVLGFRTADKTRSIFSNLYSMNIRVPEPEKSGIDASLQLATELDIPPTVYAAGHLRMHKDGLEAAVTLRGLHPSKLDGPSEWTLDVRSADTPWGPDSIVKYKNNHGDIEEGQLEITHTIRVRKSRRWFFEDIQMLDFVCGLRELSASFHRCTAKPITTIVNEATESKFAAMKALFDRYSNHGVQNIVQGSVWRDADGSNARY